MTGAVIDVAQRATAGRIFLALLRRDISVARRELPYFLLRTTLQPLLFIVESFDHLFELVDRLEKWMRDGKLYNVAPGLPEVNENDLRSFMEAGDSM